MWRLVHVEAGTCGGWYMWRLVLFTLTQVRARFLLLTRLIPFHYEEYKVSVFLIKLYSRVL